MNAREVLSKINKSIIIKESINYIDREWTCPYCGSQMIDTYKIYKGSVDKVRVKCSDCEKDYWIFSDMDNIEKDGSLMGAF